jgi:hypothetical protein
MRAFAAGLVLRDALRAPQDEAEHYLMLRSRA